ncbi:MAG: helix-turn-helix domain-containing protein [Alphaproteobacteria bacterium]
MVRVPRAGAARAAARQGDEHADPVDIHVGRRLRQRRALLGMSQDKLGRAVGLTFQQIQKYERGANRIGASRLLQLSRALAVPISYFFEDAPGAPTARGRKADGKLKGAPHKSAVEEAAARDPFARRETLDLVRAYYAIVNPSVRKRVLELVRALSKPAP